MTQGKYALGLDFGTDSARALIADAHTGEEIGSGASKYKRWADGAFCDRSKDQYRQHPLDHIESMTESVHLALRAAVAKSLDKKLAEKIIGIGVDTTGSTPGPVDKNGMPPAMSKEFSKNPNGMFILWKDHTAVAEAEEINRRAKQGKVDYTQYCGGTYSSEWFWSKILHTMRVADKKLLRAIDSWMEHADWVVALLTGNSDPLKAKRSRCAAGHKGLWHSSWKLPFAFLKSVDKRLGALEGKLYTATQTSDQIAGKLSPEWSARFGLRKGLPVAVGMIDAHAGAVGLGIQPKTICRIVGTSTCDMVVASSNVMKNSHGKEKLISGICGQVDGSIIPGLYGLEAGQSAVGDIFANFRDMFVDLALQTGLAKSKDRETLKHQVYETLTRGAEEISPEQVPLVIPYFAGRRVVRADQRLTGAELGLTLSADAFKRFAGLVQGTCYEARQIMELFTSQGIAIDNVIACGGIADKSPYVMQTMADVMGVPIGISESAQTCALGAAILGATVGGAYNSIQSAQKKMAAGFKARYRPQAKFRKAHDRRYKLYLQSSNLLESTLRDLK